jgi:hypothetical protein
VHHYPTKSELVLATMASVMMRPPGAIVRAYDIPRGVIREAYGPGTPSRDRVRESLRKVRSLLIELDLVGPLSKRLWRAFDIWDDPEPAPS